MGSVPVMANYYENNVNCLQIKITDRSSLLVKMCQSFDQAETTNVRFSMTVPLSLNSNMSSHL